MIDSFFMDLKKFGGRRALARDLHNDRKREVLLRQRQLAIIGTLFIGAFAITQVSAFALLAVLLFTTAAREAKRFRACGRYWQCRRSIEVIGI